MRAIKRINNNVAVCLDGAGHELLAMGKGIGFGTMPRKLSLDDVERTFYDVDERFFSAINDLPVDVMAFAIKAADYVRGELAYQLSPNLAFTLADHLAFAIQRTKKNLHIRMPLAYDVEQTYPEEYRIARHIVRRLRRELQVALPDDEASAVAMNLVNARVESASEDEVARQREDDEMLEDVTEIIEDSLALMSTARRSRSLATPPTCATFSSACMRAKRSIAVASMAFEASKASTRGSSRASTALPRILRAPGRTPRFRMTRSCTW